MLNSNLIPGQHVGADYWQDIILGRIPGKAMFAVNGTNMTLPNSPNQVDISTQGGVFVPPVSAVTLEIVSSSASDTVGGVGTSFVSVTTLDSNRVVQTELTPLNGTTPVTLTLSALRPRVALGLVSGTNRKNVGTISIREPGGQTWLQMMVGKNNTFNGFYSVPAGITAYVINVSTTMAKNDEAEFEPWLILPSFTEISGQPFSLFEGVIDRRLRAPAALLDDQDVVFRGRALSAGTSNVSIIIEILEVTNER